MTNEQARAAVRIAMKKNASGTIQAFLATWMKDLLTDLGAELKASTGLTQVDVSGPQVPTSLELSGELGDQKARLAVNFAIGADRTHRDILVDLVMEGIPAGRKYTKLDYGFEMTAEQMKKPILDWVEGVMKEEPKKKPAKK